MARNNVNASIDIEYVILWADVENDFMNSVALSLKILECSHCDLQGIYARGKKHICASSHTAELFTQGLLAK